MAIITHDSLRVGVAAYHLTLPVAEPLVERARDRRSPQVVRRGRDRSLHVAYSLHRAPKGRAMRSFEGLIAVSPV